VSTDLHKFWQKSGVECSRCIEHLIEIRTLHKKNVSLENELRDFAVANQELRDSNLNYEWKARTPVITKREFLQVGDRADSLEEDVSELRRSLAFQKRRVRTLREQIDEQKLASRVIRDEKDFGHPLPVEHIELTELDLEMIASGYTVENAGERA
jgi:predicted RNase H-like nuclease (RuvC/YqgF family)